MPYAHILEWPTFLVHENIVQFVQGVQSLHHVPKHRVLPVEVVDVVAQCDEELAATAALGPVLQTGGNCHRHGPLFFVFEPRYEFGCEVAWGFGALP